VVAGRRRRHVPQAGPAGEAGLQPAELVGQEAAAVHEHDAQVTEAVGHPPGQQRRHGDRGLEGVPDEVHQEERP